MMQNKIKKISVVGLSIGLLVFWGWYAQRTESVKAMPEDTAKAVVSDKEKAGELKAVEENITSQVGSFNVRSSTELTQNGDVLEYTDIWLNVSEVISKTNQEIIADIEPLLDFKVKTKIPDVPTETRISSVSNLQEDSRGLINIAVECLIDNVKYTNFVAVLILPNEVFGEADGVDWETIPLGSDRGVIENPINHSKLGFPGRGIAPVGDWNLVNDATDMGFLMLDGQNKGYVSPGGPGLGGNGRVIRIPYINSKPVYYDLMKPINQLGIGKKFIDSQFDKKYFLRKGNILKEILLDSDRSYLYVYELKKEKNLNFSIYTYMYNLYSAPISLGILELVDTDFYGDLAPIKALVNSSGFYIVPEKEQAGKDMRFTIKLKDSFGNWLSDFQKYNALDAIPYSQISSFGTDLSLTGQEVNNYPEGYDLYVPGYAPNSIYQLTSGMTKIQPDEALKVGYEMFAGEEIPYMDLALVSGGNVHNIYNNQEKRSLDIGFKVSKIPDVGVKGNLNVSYPDGLEQKYSFVADQEKKYTSEFSLDLDKLPNEEVGTIKQTNINLLATVDDESKEYNGLPSNDFGLQVNVYNFGGTPVLQMAKKDSVWNKAPEELITDPVVLPTHKIAYEYANGQPDTSKEVGIQWTEVRMTDKQDTAQTKIIKVPVLIVDEPFPTGLFLNAEDIYLNQSEVVGLTASKIEELIINKSKAAGYDVTTGLTKDVELSVTKTTLTGRPDVTIPHSATIQASKAGFPSVTKDIGIYFVEEPMINARLTVAKPKIQLGERNTYTATFKDESEHPTKLLDVTLGTSALPDFVTADVDSFRVKIGEDEEKVLDPKDIIFDPGGSFDIKLHEIPAGAQVTVTFDFLTSRDVPPPSFDEYYATVELEYLLKGRRADGKPIQNPFYSDLTEFLVLEPTSAIEINYLMEDTNTPIPNEYTKTMSGNIGDESELLEFSIDNYVLSKVQFDGKDQVLPTQAFKVKFGDVEKITFYYKGVLKIKSAPTAYDFGLEVSSSKKIRVDNPTPIGMPFIVADTRTSSSGWSLQVKLTEELLNDDGKTTLKNAVRYKSGETETILNNQAIKVVQKVNPGEYDVSKDWSATGDGLKLEIAPGAVNALGKYHGEILFELGETP